MEPTILQHPIFTKFAFPFFLIFFITFALLEKTKIFGDGKKQINALVAFVIGLIFVSVAYPKDIVNNLILFLTVAIVVVFVFLLLWGFISGEEAKLPGMAGLKWVALILLTIAVIIAVFWAMGIESQVYGMLFKQSWSNNFWTNFTFIVVVAVALAVAIKSGK